jgi:ssDNA-binding Zn-finger/Zn-ribbon topoisomerase 1
MKTLKSKCPKCGKKLKLNEPQNHQLYAFCMTMNCNFLKPVKNLHEKYRELKILYKIALSMIHGGSRREILRTIRAEAKRRY